jgi:acetyl esterase/lipase
MPEVDLSRRIVYSVDGMTNATVRRGLAYKRDHEAELLMDVYTPPRPARSRAVPAIIFVHGGPISPEMMAPREWGVFRSYGELAAASGLAAVVFNHRLSRRPPTRRHRLTWPRRSTTSAVMETTWASTASAWRCGRFQEADR